MKLRARAEVLIFKRNRVLCAIKHYVMFPGGGIDVKESALDAARRETFEETGRKLVHASVAHPPTTQIWPKGYQKGKDYDGGFSYWMTGSAADIPVSPYERHKDFETKMDWLPVKEVIQKLKTESAKDESWGDDVKVRIKILETHLDMQREHKEAFSGLSFTSRSLYPVLSIGR